MAITTVVLGMIAAPVAYIVRDIVDSPITPEEFARIAIALRGGFAGPDGTNYLNVVFGGTFLRTSAPAVPGHEPTRLIDTWATARVPGWRSAAPLPVEMAFALPDRTIANRVILRPHPAEPVGTWAREFEVSFSIGSPEGPWTPVVASALDPSKVSAPPVTGDGPRGDDRFHVPPFDVPETPVRWVRLVVSSNGGSPDYTSLGEFEVLYSAPGTRTSPVPPDRGPQGRAGG